MRQIASLILLLISSFGFITYSGFYDLTYKRFDGSKHVTSEHYGKRMLIVLLPTTPSEAGTTYLKQLDSLSQTNAGLVILGVLSYEDGYQEAAAQEIQNWYNTLLNENIIVTAGTFTRKTSPEQGNLLRWLTSANENGNFEQEVTGAGQQFFVDGQGQLVGVFSSVELRWSNNIYKGFLP